jgi:hypothetical protein
MLGYSFGVGVTVAFKLVDMRSTRLLKVGLYVPSSPVLRPNSLH